MANNLRVFNTNSEYQSADLVHPAVSYVIETDKVIYEPTTPPTPVFQGKWKAIYQDSHVESAQCDSSSAITQNEINKTNLVSVEIGDCVTSIGVGAFAGCTSLTSIDIPSGVTSIGSSVFRDCTSLTSIEIPSGVTSIGEFTFYTCRSLTSIAIPNSVTSIGEYAFSHCDSLTSCTIGSGVTSIGNQSFAYNGIIRKITIKAVIPPTIKYFTFYNTNNCPILVPSQSVNAYKSASGWSSVKSRIYPIP